MMNVEESTLTNTSYTSREEYLTDLKIIEEKLEKIVAATKTKNGDYINNIHEEIKSNLEPTVLKSDLAEILEKVSLLGQIRFDHKIPPGYEDGIKSVNIFGDLIIWFEILNYCKSEQKKKIIFLTNDNKKDWMYAPFKIVEGGRTKPNTKPFKIADKRLVHEFQLTTQSEDFYIINFETLAKIVISNGYSNFINLAKAIQLVQNSEQIESLDQQNDPSARDQEHIESESQDGPTIITENIVSNDLNDDYSTNAKQDSIFNYEEFSYMGMLIDNLKTYDWYTQNNGISEITFEKLNDLPEDHTNKDLLFVLGRNIYQAACGGAWNAIDYLNSLEISTSQYNPFVYLNMVNGMLYEVYFDSKNNFRNQNLKTTFFNELISIRKIERFSDSINYINRCLSSHSDDLIYLPSNEDNPISINLRYETTEDDWGNSTNIIKEISYNSISLIKESSSSYYGQTTLFGSAEEISTRLSVFFAIPIDLLIIDWDPSLSNLYEFILPNGIFLGKPDEELPF
jgi:hypothetical protein